MIAFKIQIIKKNLLTTVLMHFVINLSHFLIKKVNAFCNKLLSHFVMKQLSHFKIISGSHFAIKCHNKTKYESTTTIDSKNKISLCLGPCSFCAQCLLVLCPQGMGVFLSLSLDKNSRMTWSFCFKLGTSNFKTFKLKSKVFVICQNVSL